MFIDAGNEKYHGNTKNSHNDDDDDDDDDGDGDGDGDDHVSNDNIVFI